MSFSILEKFIKSEAREMNEILSNNKFFVANLTKDTSESFIWNLNIKLILSFIKLLSWQNLSFFFLISLKLFKVSFGDLEFLLSNWKIFLLNIIWLIILILYWLSL